VTASARVTILNRTRVSGERLAADLHAQFLPLDEWVPNRYEILINTTPVGMHPETNATPIPKEDLTEEMVVMDIVYNPLETRLLKDAAANGCRIINGADMFVFQGAKQFELWTGQKAPVDVMRAAVLEALQAKKTG
jgi:shikimate dehydrogenase